MATTDSHSPKSSVRKIVRSSGESTDIYQNNNNNPSNKTITVYHQAQGESIRIGRHQHPTDVVQWRVHHTENLSSNKSVNLKGWYVHRYVPDQKINVIFKFDQDTLLTSGDKLKVVSRLHAQRTPASIKSVSMHEGLNNPSQTTRVIYTLFVIVNF